MGESDGAALNAASEREALAAVEAAARRAGTWAATVWHVGQEPFKDLYALNAAIARLDEVRRA